MKYFVSMLLDGSGVRCGGRPAGFYTKLIEAEDIGDLLRRMVVGRDCLKFDVTLVQENDDEE